MIDLNPQLEWQPYIQDKQWGPGLNYDFIPSDLADVDALKDALAETPVGDGPTNYDVRATYDSRLINSYDFHFAQLNVDVAFDEIWTIGFMVPFGYRAVVRKIKVIYDNDLGGPVGNSWIVPLANTTPPGSSVVTTFSPYGNVQQFFASSTTVAFGSGVPNNTQIPIGAGDTVDTFFLVEEGTWFGVMGQDSNLATIGTTTASMDIYGQLIPSENMQLPFAIGNPIGGRRS
jgi:hypothetical protein